MLRGNSKTVEVSLMLLHVSALSGSAALISVGRLLEALSCAIVASVCVLLLSGAGALAQLIEAKISEWAARQSATHALPKSKDRKKQIPSK